MCCGRMVVRARREMKAFGLGNCCCRMEEQDREGEEADCENHEAQVEETHRARRESLRV